MSTMTTPKPALPEPVALIDPRALARGDASLHCITRPEYRSIADADAGVEYVPVYTRAAMAAAHAALSEQPAPARVALSGDAALKALAELVALKDLIDRVDETEVSPAGFRYPVMRSQEADSARAEYKRRKPLAWAAARAVIAEYERVNGIAPAQGEQL